MYLQSPGPRLRLPFSLFFYLIKGNPYHLPLIILYIVPHLRPLLRHAAGLDNFLGAAGTAVQPQGYALEMIGLQLAPQGGSLLFLLFSHKTGRQSTVIYSRLLLLSSFLRDRMKIPGRRPVSSKSNR